MGDTIWQYWSDAATPVLLASYLLIVFFVLRTKQHNRLRNIAIVSCAYVTFMAIGNTTEFMFSHGHTLMPSALFLVMVFAGVTTIHFVHQRYAYLVFIPVTMGLFALVFNSLHYGMGLSIYRAWIN